MPPRERRSLTMVSDSGSPLMTTGALAGSSSSMSNLGSGSERTRPLSVMARRGSSIGGNSLAGRERRECSASVPAVWAGGFFRCARRESSLVISWRSCRVCPRERALMLAGPRASRFLPGRGRGRGIFRPFDLPFLDVVGPVRRRLEIDQPVQGIGLRDRRCAGFLRRRDDREMHCALNLCGKLRPTNRQCSGQGMRPKSRRLRVTTTACFSIATAAIRIPSTLSNDVPKTIESRPEEFMADPADQFPLRGFVGLVLRDGSENGKS
jgi:hypothetical protein